MITQTTIPREIASIALCVAGLSFMMIGFFVIADKFDLSVVLGTIAGSSTAILDYSLYVITLQVSTRCDPSKAVLAIVLSRVFRIVLMSTVAFLDELVNFFKGHHHIAGIGQGLAHFKERRLPLVLQRDRFLGSQIRVGSRARHIRRDSLGGDMFLGGLWAVCYLPCANLLFRGIKKDQTSRLGPRKKYFPSFQLSTQNAARSLLWAAFRVM